jgi:hypothetical protein
MASGRGRLSSIDLMPEEGQEDIAWAMEQLNARAMTQAQILEELNGRLIDKGLADYIISKSAFNRRSMRIANMNRRYEERTAIVKAMAPRMTPESMEEVDRVIGELQKMLFLEILDRRGDELTPKNAMEIARGYQAVIQAQAKSADMYQKRLKAFEKKAAAAVDQVARKAGLTAATVDELKAQILGIRKEG